VLVNPFGDPAPLKRYLIFKRAAGSNCPADPLFPPPHGTFEVPVSPGVVASPFHPDDDFILGGSDEQGQIRRGGLSVGDYCLYVTPPYEQTNLLVQHVVAFQLPDESALVDLGEIALLVPNKRIQGSVRDGHGVGLSGAGVSLMRHDDADLLYGIATDEAGTFVLDADQGVWDVVISPAGWWGNTANDFRQTVRFADDQTPEIKVVEYTIYQMRLPLIFR
jgi:hypothetical protein